MLGVAIGSCTLVGDSFPDTGIEIILHDLTNPATALSCMRC